MKLSDKVYDVLKWIALICIPALATFYVACAGVWAPLTAALFCMEFENVGAIFSPALLPCYIAAFTASSVSSLLGISTASYYKEKH